MDRVLKAHFDRFREKNQLPPELAKEETNAALFKDRDLLDAWRSAYRGVQWTDPETGIMFMGAVDEILEKEGKLIVLDYKTRGYALKENTASLYQEQLDIYTLLLQKNNYSTEEYAYLLFYIPKEVKEDGNFIFDAHLVKMKVNVENGARLLKQAADLVLNPTPPGPSERCFYCNLGWASS